MYESKLLSLLRCIEPGELEDLEKFLSFPLVNTNKRLIRIFSHLRALHPAFPRKKVTKQALFRTFYPGEPLSRMGKMRKTLSKLTGLIEQYIRWRHLESDRFLVKKYTANAYRDRNCYKYYRQYTHQAIEELQKRPSPSLNYYLEIVELEQKLHYHPESVDLQTLPFSQSELMDHLDRLYFCGKLQFSFDHYNRKQLRGEEQDILLIDEVLERAPHFATDHPFIQLFHSLILLQHKDRDDERFRDTLRYFLDQLEHFDPVLRHNIFLSLVNYSIRQSRSNRPEAMAQLLELYKLGLKKQLLVFQGFLSENTFLNIAYTAAKADDISFLEYLLQKYAPLVPDKRESDAVKLAQALLLYHDKKYDRAIRLCRTINQTDPIYKIRVYVLTIRCYFEFLQEESFYGPLLRAECRDFKKYICEKATFKESSKKEVLNFILQTREMASSLETLKKDPERLSAFEEKIRQTDFLYARDWFLEMIARWKNPGGPEEPPGS